MVVALVQASGINQDGGLCSKLVMVGIISILKVRRFALTGCKAMIF